MKSNETMRNRAEVDTVDFGSVRLEEGEAGTATARALEASAAEVQITFFFLNHRDNFTQALFVSLQGNASADWGTCSGKIGSWGERDSIRRIYSMSPPFYVWCPEVFLSHPEEIQQNSTPYIFLCMYTCFSHSVVVLFSLCLSFSLKMKLYSSAN